MFQHLVCQFMHKGGELLRLRLSGENGNPAAIADAQRGCDVFGKDKLDVLLVDERIRRARFSPTSPLISRMAGSSALSV
jgi:hypothetical protein